MIDETKEYKNNFRYFPYVAVFALLGVQLAGLSLFAFIHDKRRIPLFTMFGVGLSYAPMAVVIRRGMFGNYFEGFYSLGLFFSIPVFCVFFVLLGTSSRRHEKTNWFGIFTLIGLFIAFSLTIFFYQSLSIILITVAPFLLLVERFTHCKHRWLSLVGWVMTAAQGLSYSVVLLSEKLMRASMVKYRSINENFPSKLYWMASLVCLFCCLFGPHLKISEDWKIAGMRMPEQVQTVEQEREPQTISRPRRNVMHHGVFIIDDSYASTPNDQATTNLNQEYEAEGGDQKENLIVYDPF